MANDGDNGIAQGKGVQMKNIYSCTERQAGSKIIKRKGDRPKGSACCSAADLLCRKLTKL
jgi:hypothetical protein